MASCRFSARYPGSALHRLLMRQHKKNGLTIIDRDIWVIYLFPLRLLAYVPNFELKSLWFGEDGK